MRHSIGLLKGTGEAAESVLAQHQQEHPRREHH